MLVNSNEYNDDLYILEKLPSTAERNRGDCILYDDHDKSDRSMGVIIWLIFSIPVGLTLWLIGVQAIFSLL